MVDTEIVPEAVKDESAHKRVTLSDVAVHANVSRATASLVLRNAGRVADDTRDRVRASMDTLGYVYHRGAASLRTRRTQTVGLIVSDVSNGFTAELTLGVEEALAQAGIVTLTANTLEDPRRQDLLVRSMLERQVDGILAIPAVGSDSMVFEDLAKSRVPAVIASREINDPKLSYVGIDNARGGRLAGDHMMRHGVRRVGFLGGFTELGPRHDRVHGVLQSMRSKDPGAALDIDLPGSPGGAWGLEITRRLIAEGSLPDGIICHNDQVAFGVYRALREMSPRTLRKVRVVSFDNVAEAAWWEPPLTTVAASGRDVGERSAEVLLRHIADPGRAPDRSLITPTLIVRESCGCTRTKLGT